MSARQFSEILQLLVEIKKLKRRHLMLQRQLHSEEVKQEVGVLDDIVKIQSGTSMSCATFVDNQGSSWEATVFVLWIYQLYIYVCVCCNVGEVNV